MQDRVVAFCHFCKAMDLVSEAGPFEEACDEQLGDEESLWFNTYQQLHIVQIGLEAASEHAIWLQGLAPLSIASN